MLLTAPVKPPIHRPHLSVDQQYRLQEQAREWLCDGKDWVNLDGCHRWPAAARPGAVSEVGLHADPATHTGHFSGLQTCQNAKVCAVCAAAAAETNRAEIREAAILQRQSGGTLLLITLTSSHHHNILEQLYDRFGAARRALFACGSWKRVKAAVGCKGMIEAIENTWSVDHGWHLHTHLLFFMSGRMHEEYVAAVRDYLSRAWPYALRKQGMSCSAKHGVDVRDADWDAAEYLTKMGHERAYGVGAMLTDVDHDHADSLSVWDLLRLGSTPVGVVAKREAVGADGQDVATTSTGVNQAQVRALFIEYAYVTRGKHSIRWSQGLRERLGMDPPEKEEPSGAVVDEEEEEKEPPADACGPTMLCFGYMPADQWRLVIEQDARVSLLEALGTCEYDQIAELILSLGIDWIPERPYLTPLPVPRR